MLEVMVKYACFNGLFCSSPEAKRKFSSISDAPPSENYFGCRPAANKIFLYFSLQYMNCSIEQYMNCFDTSNYGNLWSHISWFLKWCKRRSSDAEKYNFEFPTIFFSSHFPKKNIFAAARMRFIFVTRCAGNKALFSFGLILTKMATFQIQK